ncbi:MAG: hypothetical protein A3D67_03520 [Candidatus Lloydbacteria bacterium RIFCSPHIGHO2_02_FULL_51_22]|uniref:Uncharacterized protein n=2 Tax=Candidatus Lloydiibacteriota TaxID=1817910 RepID=A0A1G2DBH2_9BACT|nr:MAG: hypothetical protein A3D67_03520 [Candidatus Lloydbacteria bacterium RIFCSPHIGHO2_02_FULL_51_22]OGZ15834.1 MAG: hypothetical protein A3G11_02625 [Candidatus Lloydbacteria bacterium RIFCSPLOWO2_12_FULL_51_9]
MTRIIIATLVLMLVGYLLYGVQRVWRRSRKKDELEAVETEGEVLKFDEQIVREQRAQRLRREDLKSQD